MLIPAVSAGEERVLIDPWPVPAAELITPAGQNLLTILAAAELSSQPGMRSQQVQTACQTG